MPLSKLKDSFLDGTSSTYLEELEERYRSNPQSVDKSWASFFHSMGARGPRVWPAAPGRRRRWGVCRKAGLTHHGWQAAGGPRVCEPCGRPASGLRTWKCPLGPPAAAAFQCLAAAAVLLCCQFDLFGSARLILLVTAACLDAALLHHNHKHARQCIRLTLTAHVPHTQCHCIARDD